MGAPIIPRAVLPSVDLIEQWARGLKHCGDFVALVDDRTFAGVVWPGDNDRKPGRIEFWEVRYSGGRWYRPGREPIGNLQDDDSEGTEGREFEPVPALEVHDIQPKSEPSRSAIIVSSRPHREVPDGICANDKWCADTGDYEACAQKLGHRDQCRTRRELDARNAARMARRKARKD
jgi:hypothetical protein